MYNESINTNNKIISTDLILNIFGRMNELIKSYTSKANKEEQTYNSLSFENQLNMKREFSNFISDFSFTVDFYDSTNITINNYESFMGIFNSRPHEIRSIISNFSISYFDVNNKSCSNSINLMIFENSFDIRVAIDNSNNEMTELFNYIKSSIYGAPEKYDFVMKNKSKICFLYTFALGSIVAIILSVILVCMPPVFSILTGGYWMLFPVICLILGYFLGTLLFSGSISNLYKNIDMEKIYDGYDPNTFESKYKSDKNSYINSSEVIIGKNIDNLSNRNKIKDLYYEKKKYIKFELIAIVVITLILLLIQTIK